MFHIWDIEDISRTHLEEQTQVKGTTDVNIDLQFTFYFQ